jgi:transcriptional regulator with XRE-family HTH domain
MTLLEAFQSRLRGLAAERGMTMYGLAMHSGLARSSLMNLMDGHSKNPSLKTIKILCDGLDVSLAAFFDAPEFNGLEQEIQ